MACKFVGGNGLAIGWRWRETAVAYRSKHRVGHLEKLEKLWFTCGVL